MKQLGSRFDDVSPRSPSVVEVNLRNQFTTLDDPSIYLLYWLLSHGQTYHIVTSFFYPGYFTMGSATL